ncbi:TonB system transport protein ExbD [Campylobacter ureolyticus RIGS 9880]|uniref:Biopolymer transporter ExbD n=2 Tax=Campylobacter ureolyticus TaxID=827 RepID=A0A2I1NA70_9BACT|nr:biopolymer transporter ExbD [Campylobacter ureolyticus]AKT90097.1 TonB system transport protein ExbD [Campylobacter ureolyticus RIGS 9880]MCZ6111420.1 biopolymer transporter ExbD [Campylobacter ureolyticus]MCZ6168796.1 biopolymer transporter ExbD [Campylobacter ureolyticus]MDU7070368.1 biopolymer transporter ExbD [Campylobacter ureolyticus]PKZ29283.1 biopolymer transporter ExbD [Campylobacter ureolyticus]
MIRLESDKELNEINVTPFIDVMLVLLIIFMVVTPLMTTSVKVELPKGSENLQKDENKKPLILSIDKEKNLFLDDEIINLSNLKEILFAKTSGNFDEIIYFYVDKSVEYEVLINAINSVKTLGYSKIALSSKLEN